MSAYHPDRDRDDRSAGSRPPRPTSDARRRCPTRPSTRSSLVLDEIRLGRSRSRSELVDRTGLGRAIVAQRVGELIDRGLVVEGDVGPSTGGRPPRQLAFRADGGPCPRRRPRRDEHRRRADDPRRPDPRPPRRAGPDRGRTGHLSRPGRRAVRPAAARRPSDVPGRLWGIGIGVPGPVEFGPGGRSRHRSCPAGTATRSATGSPARYGAPVWVDNDVNVLALGEWRSGVAAGHDDVVVVKIGTGIGAGIISDGRLHRGAQGSAGDVGHIQVVDDPAVVCRCGNVGCLEALAGGAALGRAGRGGGPRRPQPAARDGPGPARLGHAPRTSPGRRRSATRSRSRCSRRPAGGSARCWRASSTSSTRR